MTSLAASFVEAKELFTDLNFPDASMALLQQRALQKRVDTKFILRLDTLRNILANLTDDYALVRAGAEPVGQYKTLYFDTEEFSLVQEHHRGRRPRYKVRIRHYLDRHLTYLEVKKKNNANTTIKARRPITFQEENLNTEDFAFVDEHMPGTAHSLQPSLRTDFGRITLVGRNTMERATFDVDLQFDRNNNHEGLPRLVIAEIKQDRFRARTPLMMAFRRHGVRPQSISKYCTAALMLCPNLRLNRFYPILRSIQKTCRG